MKNLLSAITLLFAITSFAQLPDKNLQLLVGKQVKIGALSDYDKKYNSGYRDFYSDPETRKVYMRGENSSTKPEALDGRVFTVVSVKPSTERKGAYDYDKFIIELQDNNGETVYNVYMLYYGTDLMPLELVLPADYYCNYVEFDENSYSFRLRRTEYYISRNFIGPDPYMFSILLYKDKPLTNSKMLVTLELENGKKLTYPESIVSPIGKDEMLGVFYPKLADIKLMQEFRIVGVSFGEQKSKMSDRDAVVIRGVLNCMAARKK